MFKIICLLTACFFAQGIYAQIFHYPSCGQKEITEQLFKKNPEIKKHNEQIEKLLVAYKKKKNSGIPRNRNTESTVTLPIVIHIVHNNGPENISDATVMQGFKHLNEAFANAGYYTSVNGANTHIQFCMAERDPDGNATNGITRNVSAYTNMGGEYYSDDLNVKNLNRWNSDEYINVWLVNSIPGDVVGYAYLPSAAGTNVDGIVMEAAYFGSAVSNDVVIIHEIGHYLGLYHTFEGGCTNNDCITDGDKVCDTPPDQSTANVSCNINMNTCITDVLSGFNSDQNDLKEDFMDYGNFDCIKVFTPGQDERMNWFVQNVRYSLLSAKSCLPPCTQKVNAIFSSSAKNVLAGAPVNFTNKSINANSYKWYVDGILQFSSVNYTYTFTTAGMHIVKLLAQSNNALCDDDIALDTIMVACSAKADFNFTTGVIKANDAVSFTNTSTNASAYAWKIDGIIKSNSFNLSYTFPLPGVYTVTLIAAGNICSDSISKKVSVYDSTGVIPAEKCTITTFQKDYTGNSRYVFDFHPLKDSNYIMCGFYFIPSVSGEGGLVTKIDKKGSVLWSKYLLKESWLRLYKIKETADGNLITTGRFYESLSNKLITRAALLKLNGKGDLLWAKKFGVSGSNGENGADVTETKDGGYAFCGSDNDDEWKSVNWLVVKTDANGNVVWSKKFDDGFYERAYSIISDKDTLIVCGIRTLPTGPRSEIVVTKLNAKDGSVIQSKTFDVDNRSVETTTIRKTPQGFIVSAHSIADGFYYADMNIVILQLDETLNLIRAGKINSDIYASINGAIDLTTDGGLVAMQTGIEGAFADYKPIKSFLYKINSQWQLEWAKEFPVPINQVDARGYENSINQAADNGYIFLATLWDSAALKIGVRIYKTDDKGNTPGCLTDTFQTNFVNPVVTTNDFTWPIIGNVNFNDPADPAIKNPDIKDAATTEKQLCSTSLCDSLKIIGSDSVCNIKDTILYKAYRNPSCAWPVEWIIDTAFARIISKTDSSVNLKFYKTGNSKISARILTACKVLQDDRSIYINDAPATLNLGADIQLCKWSTVKLSAGSGFKNYTWNDGSVDSTLTAYNTGEYYVTAIDYCGNYFSDTINITQAPEISLHVAHDLKRCDNDTVEIAAPAGFQNYIWSPRYNINSTSGNIVKVWPDVDTTYLLTVQITNACTAIDTAHVQTSLKSLPLDIGNDTSFCSGDYITLKAPSGFKQYTWQDGSTGQSLKAFTKGIYSLQALNNNGCISKDTMEIEDVYALPIIDLGKDGMVCMNNDNTLYAGDSFISYLWQDGSTQKTMPVNKPGKYWVSVMDNNHCTNSDTINITGLIPEPQGFLTKQIEICNHEKTELKASGNWQFYLWNDNTTMPYLVISSAGKYWLKVKDFNGCSGEDTTDVLLKPNCKDIIYFPSAFTPDKNGQNDVFKPTAFAPLEMYKIVIYNRWGQKIYESDNIAQGWNGIFNNRAAETGTYIWQGIYKFYDEPQKTEKGTVVLIK